MISQFIRFSICLLLVNPQNIFAQSGDIFTLEEAIQLALENNPNLKLAGSQWEVMQSRILPAGTLPDPVLSFNIMNLPVNSYSFTQEPMTGKQIGLMQRFPFPGKLNLRESIAQDQSDVAEYQYEDFKHRIIKRVKLIYYDLFLIDKSIEITKKNKEIIGQFENIARVKYEVGKGLQQDILKVQVEQSKFIDKLINLNQQRKTMMAKLNTLLDLSPQTPVDKTEDLRKINFPFTIEQLQDTALINRPVLKAYELIIESNMKSYQLAKKEYFPDFNIGIIYSQRSPLDDTIGKGYDFLSAGISFNIPIYYRSKQRHKVAESTASISKANEHFHSVKNEIFLRVSMTHADIEKDQDLINLFETGIIPQASQSLNSAIAGYQVDKVDFLTLLNNFITLFNFELEYYRVLADLHKKIADMEAIVGTSLF